MDRSSPPTTTHYAARASVLYMPTANDTKGKESTCVIVASDFSIPEVGRFFGKLLEIERRLDAEDGKLLDSE